VPSSLNPPGAFARRRVDATKRMARMLGPSMIALVNGFLPGTQFFTVTGATFLLSALAGRASARGWPRGDVCDRAGGCWPIDVETMPRRADEAGLSVERG